MAKANPVFTPVTLKLIAAATETAAELAASVEQFAHIARAALGSFDSDLRFTVLPDEDYEALYVESGLRAVLDSADAMASVLSTLEDAA